MENRSVWPRRGSQWERAGFDFALISCGVFVVLTALAMAFYPGGTSIDAGSAGYHFWLNFFSDLGRTRARNGTANPVAALLFEVALIAAGAALAIFHVALARALWRGASARALLADCATMALAMGGAIAGACFVEVATHTADLAPYKHAFYVVWAFRFFLLASFFSGALIARRPAFPRVLVRLIGAFTVLLFAYLLLIWRGPAPDTTLGLAIQATSQKIVVYAAVLCVGAQAWALKKSGF